MEPITLVTGGAGYVGACAVEQLLESGRKVRVLDILLHGQKDVAERLEKLGAEVMIGDIRDAATRTKALDGVTDVVHLAAIVGDPACARDPELSHETNVVATKALEVEARKSGVRRFTFASTCSNYGRMDDPTVPITEEGKLAPVSLYAEQKVEIERLLLGEDQEDMTTTCLRFATVYGMAPRMRFDLTVNEFTRDLWADKDLEVFGEQFWRPYVHVRDAARAVATVLKSPEEVVGGEVFNVGNSEENYRKVDLIKEIKQQIDRGRVSYVKRTEDPRDYKVNFDKAASVLGFRTTKRVPDGIREIIQGLEAGAFKDPYSGRYRNIP